MGRFVASLIALAVLAAACGDTGTGTVATSLPPETALPTETSPPTSATTTTPPTTAAATTTTTAPPAGIVPGEDPEVDAVVTAYQVAFDRSEGPVDQAIAAAKAHVDGPHP